MYTLVMQLQNMPYFACSSYEKKSSDTCHITALFHNGHILKKGPDHALAGHNQAHSEMLSTQGCGITRLISLFSNVNRRVRSPQGH